MPIKKTVVVNKKVTPKTVVKKTVAKVAPKKSIVATKKVISKKPATATAKVLVYASNDNSFWVNDGQVLNSLIALQEALNKMQNEVFAYHVRKDKNDFADWVDFVLCDGKCSSDLRKTKTKVDASVVVSKHLKSYKA